MGKPSIVLIIGQHVHLRKAGREMVGRCPFHNDKTPSFSVSEEKGLFYCFGCGQSGDVFDFIMKLDGLTFPEAKRVLGIEAGSRRLTRVSPHRKAATLLAQWLNRQHLLVGARCRELSRQIALSDEIPGGDLSTKLRREWEILADLHEDLVDPTYSAGLWESRTWIEQLIADVAPEPLPEFPPITEPYKASLRSVL